MTYKDVANVVKSFGIPYAYNVFRDTQELPYCVFLYPGNNDVMGDNSNYQTVVLVRIELYTAEKDFTLESTVESALLANDMPFSKMEDYIEQERMYMVTYESEVSING